MTSGDCSVQKRSTSQPRLWRPSFAGSSRSAPFVRSQIHRTQLVEQYSACAVPTGGVNRTETFQCSRTVLCHALTSRQPQTISLDLGQRFPRNFDSLKNSVLWPGLSERSAMSEFLLRWTISWTQVEHGRNVTFRVQNHAFAFRRISIAMFVNAMLPTALNRNLCSSL
jgi:hypothetical protein